LQDSGGNQKTATEDNGTVIGHELDIQRCTYLSFSRVIPSQIRCTEKAYHVWTTVMDRVSC